MFGLPDRTKPYPAYVTLPSAECFHPADPCWKDGMKSLASLLWAWCPSAALGAGWNGLWWLILFRYDQMKDEICSSWNMGCHSFTRSFSRPALAFRLSPGERTEGAVPATHGPLWAEQCSFTSVPGWRMSFTQSCAETPWGVPWANPAVYACFLCYSWKTPDPSPVILNRMLQTHL